MLSDRDSLDSASQEKLLRSSEDGETESDPFPQRSLRTRRLHPRSWIIHLGHILVEVALVGVVVYLALFRKDRGIYSTQLLYSERLRPCIYMSPD